MHCSGPASSAQSVYMTNAVKHFKWKPRGKRRIHMTPSQTEIVACQPWLWAEMEAVKPELVVALGAVAAKVLLGAEFRITHDHGKPLKGPDRTTVVATPHPASILRRRGGDRQQAFDDLVADLTVARQLLNQPIDDHAATTDSV
jgi:uracil-DNA glycosylase family 4